MKILRWGTWIIVNVVAAYNLGVLTFVGCWLYYFEERMPPGEGGIHRVDLTLMDIAIAIIIATFCSALFAIFMAGFGFYIHRILWKNLSNAGESNRWGWWIFLINWSIVFFPSVLMGYKFFVQRANYFFR